MARKKNFETLYNELYKYIHGIKYQHDNKIIEVYFYFPQNYILIENPEFHIENKKETDNYTLYRLSLSYETYNLLDVLTYIDTIVDFNTKIEKQKEELSIKFTKVKKEEKKVKEVVEREEDIEFEENLVEEEEFNDNE